MPLLCPKFHNRWTCSNLQEEMIDHLHHFPTLYLWEAFVCKVVQDHQFPISEHLLWLYQHALVRCAIVSVQNKSSMFSSGCSNRVHELLFLSLGESQEFLPKMQRMFHSFIVTHYATEGFMAYCPPSWTKNSKSHSIRGDFLFKFCKQVRMLRGIL